MSATPVEPFKRNRHETGGLKHFDKRNSCLHSVRGFICGGCI